MVQSDPNIKRWTWWKRGRVLLKVLLSHFKLELIVLRILTEEMLAITNHLTCLQSGGSKWTVHIGLLFSQSCLPWDKISLHPYLDAWKTQSRRLPLLWTYSWYFFLNKGKSSQMTNAMTLDLSTSSVFWKIRQWNTSEECSWMEIRIDSKCVMAIASRHVGICGRSRATAWELWEIMPLGLSEGRTYFQLKTCILNSSHWWGNVFSSSINSIYSHNDWPEDTFSF